VRQDVHENLNQERVHVARKCSFDVVALSLCEFSGNPSKQRIFRN